MSAEMKAAIEQFGKDWEEFKTQNDTRLSLVEKGQAVPADLEERLAKLDTKLSDSEALQKRLEDLEVAMKRGTFKIVGNAEEAKAHAAEYSELIQKIMRGKPDAPALGEKEQGRMAELQAKLANQKTVIGGREYKFLAVQNDPSGGYWVSPDSSGMIVLRIFETSPMRQVAAVQNISTDALEGPYDDDEAGVVWVGETETRAETSTPVIKLWRIPAHEMMAFPRITQQLLEDASVNPETWLADKVSRRFSRFENSAFVNGNGDGKPTGFLSYPDTTGNLESFERGKIGQLETAGSLAISFDDMIELLGALKDEYEQNATWAFNRRTKTALRKLKNSQGDYLWQPSIQVGDPATILGRPMIGFEDMPDSNVAAALAVAVADWSMTYQIVDRLGISVLRDPFTSPPFVKFNTRKRVGGDVVNFDSIRLLKIKA